MTTPEIALKIVADLRDDKTKADQYLEILEKTLGIGDVTSILVCVDHLTSEEAGTDIMAMVGRVTDYSIYSSGSSSYFPEGHGAYGAVC